MRILLSAYACGPGEGSEPGAGWAFAKAAAARHQVDVITRHRFRAAIERELAADPDLRLRVHYLDLGDRALRLKKAPRDVYWYYLLWQRRAGALATRLHRENGYDVIHHVTFAVDWLPCGVTAVPDVPLIWGPVGGATRPSWRLARWLGVRGLAGELVRHPFTAVARRLWGDPAATRADLVIAQNDDVAERFRHARRVIVEPNASIDLAPGGNAGLRTPVGAGPHTAVYAGRLVAWKGPHLALHALSRPEAAGWTLDLYGEGPELGRLERRARALGLDGRVRFHGIRPRDEVLAALRTADAMLFPSMHDSAGWAVAEAATLGCPVVCLDRGGPPLLAGSAGRPVPPAGNVPDALARALRDTAESGRTTPTRRWSADRLPDLLDTWYREAAQR